MNSFEKFKKKAYLHIRRMNSSRLIILVFVVVILLGALLLTLPISSRSGESNGFITALFTATSATCVTGLALGDTYTQWSNFGQVVIITLIEIGGLGFMSIASLFFFTLRIKVDLKSMLIMAQSVGTENMSDVLRIQKKIIFGSLLIELTGALILTLRFNKWYDLPKSIWLGLFHSISAFCNAGFDVLGFETPGASLIPFNTDAVIILTLSALIIIGGISFIVWDDFTRERRISRWSVYSKMVLITSFILLAVGTIAFFILEYENKRTIGSMTTSQKVLNAFFQSVTTRTAGFAAIDQAKLTETGKIISILLMFVGGASGSTAGGLKVVTFAVIVLFLLAHMRGRDTINVFGRRISDNQILSALSLFGMMTVYSFIGTIVMCGTSTARFIDCLYESVSALATVGLSVGVVPKLGLAGQILLIIYMFFGRIGILTISMGFLQGNDKHDNIKYPEVNLPIG